MRKKSFFNKRRKEQGITLVTLVITIIIIIILSTVTINMAFGDNGLIKQAQLAKDLSTNATIAEQEGMNSLLDEYGNIIGEGGSGTGGDGEEGGGDTGDGSMQDIIDDLNKTIEDLNNQLEEEKNKVTNLEEEKKNLEDELASANEELEEKQAEIDNLNGQIADKNDTISNLESTIDSLETQVANLQKKQATGTATASQVLTGYTFSNSSSVGLSGSMPNRGALNWNPSSSTTYTVPAGYYSGGTLNSSGAYNAGVSAGKYGASNYSANKTLMYGVSYDSGSAYNCTKTSNGAKATITGLSGNGLLVIYGYQGLWSNEFVNHSVSKSGTGTITQRYASYNKFPQNSGWTGGECGTGYLLIYQVSGASNMSVTITHSQTERFRLNGAVSFLK